MLYINNNLNILHGEELVELFNKEFTAPGDLSNIVFKIKKNASVYYQKKLLVGRALKLESNFLLEGLTDN